MSTSTALDDSVSEMRRQRLHNLQYQGDPDLQPVRSYEVAFLVRAFCELASYINSTWRNELAAWYSRPDVWGGMVRQVVCAPRQVHHYMRSSGLDSFSTRLTEQLPARISLRWLADQRTLFLAACLYMLAYFYKKPFLLLVLALALLFAFVFFVKSALGIVPPPRPVQAASLTADHDDTLSHTF